MIDRVLSAEEFYDQLLEFPESGRWCELVAGTVVDLEPPPTAHGAVVLNVAKALGDYCTRKQKGYACFDVRLITRRRPDTVRLPAITYYAGGPAFAEVDASLSRRAPELIVEVASTETRRRRIPEKIESVATLQGVMRPFGIAWSEASW